MTLSTRVKTILFCTDFSHNADEAYEYACDIARAHPGAEIVILHVFPDPEAQFWNSYLPEMDDLHQQALKDVEQEIQRRYQHALGDIVTHRVVLSGKDYQQILEYANTHPVDLIVIGRQGKSEWGTLLFGNVTEKISRHADCAVLIVPMSYVEKHQT
jgi:nucleotide-binding universal stress UspA family protein